MIKGEIVTFNIENEFYVSLQLEVGMWNGTSINLWYAVPAWEWENEENFDILLETTAKTV